LKITFAASVVAVISKLYREFRKKPNPVKNKSKQKSTKMLFHRANKTIRKMTVFINDSEEDYVSERKNRKNQVAKNDNNSKKIDQKCFGRAIINSMFLIEKYFSVGLSIEETYKESMYKIRKSCFEGAVLRAIVGKLDH
jgi:hypothetical protein